MSDLATYQIKKDGKLYEIKGPPGATQDQVQEQVQRQIDAERPALDRGLERVEKSMSRAAPALAMGAAGVRDVVEKVTPTQKDISREGLPHGVASDILRADNRAEAMSALKQFDPKAELHNSYHGQYVVLGNGKKVFVEPKGEGVGGSLKAAVQRTGEQLEARPFQTAGSIAGGLDRGAVGAGVAGTLGYGLDQLVKASRDQFHKTPGETIGGAAEAGGMAAAGEVAGRAPGALMRGGLPEWFTGATEKSKDLTKNLFKRGGRPAYSAAAPSMKTAQWKVDFAKKLGFQAGDENVEALTKEIEDFLGTRGVTDVAGTTGAAKAGDTFRLGGEAAYGQQLQATIKANRATLAGHVGVKENDLAQIEQLNAAAKARAETKLQGVQERAAAQATGGARALADRQRANLGAARAGATDASRALAETQRLAKAERDTQLAEQKALAEKQLADQMAGARKEAEGALQTLRTGRGRPAGDLQQTVSQDIRNAHEKASASFQTRYALLDRLETGMRAPMAPVAQVAKDILDSLPKDPAGEIIGGISEHMAPSIAMLKQIASGAGQDFSMAEMAGIRTSLYKLGGVRELIPPTKKHLIGQLYKSADDAIRSAVPDQSFGGGLLSPQQQATRLTKIQQVRDNIERDYRGYRKKFDDVLTERLVKQAGQRGSVDAEDVIGLASRSPNQFRRIWNIVTPETQRRLSRSLFDDMVGKATRNGAIDAQGFVDQLQANMKILKQVYGAETPKIIEAANGLLAVEGKVPLGKGKLMPQNVVAALKTATKTQKEMDDYFSKHSLALLAKGDEAQNRAIQEAKLAVAKKREEMANLQKAQAGEKRDFADKTAAEKAALKRRIADAGNRVTARADGRVELGKQSMKQAEEKLKEFDADYFGQMADPKFIAEHAVDYIVRPGQESLLDRAVQLYGPGSEQVKTLQEAFMRKAVRAGVKDLSDVEGAFSGDGIRDFLGKYTTKQKDILLEPYGYTNSKGQAVTGEQALNRLAEGMDHAFPPSTGDMSAGLAAGAVKAKIGPGAVVNPKGWAAIGRYGWGMLDGMILTNPGVMKYLILGLDHGPKAEAALKALDVAAHTYMQSTMANKVGVPNP